MRTYVPYEGVDGKKSSPFEVVVKSWASKKKKEKRAEKLPGFKVHYMNFFIRW